MDRPLTRAELREMKKMVAELNAPIEQRKHERDQENERIRAAATNRNRRRNVRRQLNKKRRAA